METPTNDQVSFYEKNQANFSTETLFTELYRTMVKCMGNMAKNETSHAEKKLQGKYLWILINMSWATLRVSVTPQSEVDKYDKIFHEEIITIEDAKNKIFELLRLGAEAGILIRQEYAISDYDNMFQKQGII